MELTEIQEVFIDILKTNCTKNNPTVSDVSLGRIEKELKKEFDFGTCIEPLIDAGIVDWELYTHQNVCFWLR